MFYRRLTVMDTLVLTTLFHSPKPCSVLGKQPCKASAWEPPAAGWWALFPHRVYGQDSTWSQRKPEWNTSWLKTLLRAQVSISESSCLHPQVQYFPFSSLSFCLVVYSCRGNSAHCSNMSTCPWPSPVCCFFLYSVTFSVHPLLSTIIKDCLHSTTPVHSMAPAKISCISKYDKGWITIIR